MPSILTAARITALTLALSTSQALLADEKELDAASIANVKTIAVVTLLPEVLEISYVGATVFNNFHYFGDVDWWQINRHTGLVLAEMLKQKGRFELKDVPYDRRTMTKDYMEASRSGKVEALAPYLKKLASENQVDAFVVIGPGRDTGPLCRNAAGCIGYGNSGVGIYAVGTSFGQQYKNRGEYAYVSMNVHFMLAKDAQAFASTAAAAIVAAPFIKSNEFAGIPAPMLVRYEEMIKNLVNKELPLAVVRLGVLNNSIAATQPPADPSSFPALKVDADCCRHFKTLAGDIAEGYSKAAAAGGLKLGEESAILTVKAVSTRSGNAFLGNTRGENKVEAVLSFRGNEYWIADSARLVGQLNEVAATVGQISFEKINALVGSPVKIEPPAPTANKSSY